MSNNQNLPKPVAFEIQFEDKKGKHSGVAKRLEDSKAASSPILTLEKIAEKLRKADENRQH